ncbi:MAG: radical SAM protein [Acidobacteria bacterium]|nr:radical SAM protein [Acidobacteriota bacterium]
MVFHARHGSSAYVLSLKNHSLAVGVDETRVLSWDRGGRLYSVHDEDATWRRGLSGVVLEKTSSAAARLRRMLRGPEADAVVDRAAREAQSTLRAMSSTAWSWESAVDGVVVQEARTLLALASRFTSEAARADERRFEVVYSPIGILPPDQYLSLVVQATEGCSFNTCTFCDLYHERYRVKTVDEFRQHLSGVLNYLGESVSLRSRGIFLGAANALAVPMARLVPIFEILLEEVDGVRRGVCAFVDGFAGAKKTTAEYRLLSHLGLRRVYVGLESGHAPLVALVKKPGSPADAIETVRAIKAAGVQVGVIVMVGLGGAAYDERHVQDTADTVNAMGLGAGDLVYFSELVEVPGTSYPKMAAGAGIRALSADERRAQQQRIRAALRFDGPPPQMATYDIREFVY